MQILWLFAFLLSEAGDPPSDFRPHKKEQNREVTNISNQPIIFNITYTPWKVKSTKIDTEISNYESKLKEVELNKARLEREIDSLPIDTTHRERKLHDMTLRLDALYDTIAEIEKKVEDAKLRRKSVEAEFITMENIYKILQHFGELYDIISDEEKKELIATLVKEIQIYPEGESDTPLKSMKFNFPVYKDGQEVNEIFLDKQTNVETVIKLSKVTAK